MTQNTMQNKSLEYTMNQAMEKLNQLCKNFAVLHNEQQSIKNEITSIKVKFNTKDTSKSNITVNKSIGSKLIGVTKEHNKHILIEESSDDSSYELLNLKARYQQTEQKTQKMANDFTDLKTTMQYILQFFQQSTNDNQNVKGDDDSDVEIIDISQ
jgi:hypothetical protein